MSGDELMRQLSLSPFITTLLSIGVSIVMLLLIGEITPKTFALIYPEEISERCAGIIYMSRKILMPFILVIEKVFSVILDFLGRKEAQPLDQEEYASYLDMANSVGAFSGEETELISNIFELKNMNVNAVMRARVDIFSIKSVMNAEEVAETMQKARELFYPVIDRDIDDAELFISARDFYLIPQKKRSDWKKLSTFDAVFIPENTTLTKALAQMKKNEVPVALVTDEYGGITGMLKLKDIYEELMGDVNSEFEDSDWKVRKIAPLTWIIDGNIPLQEIEELLDVKIEESQVNTLNGLFCEVSDNIPLPGKVVIYNRIRIKALRVENNRIVKAELKLLPPENEEVQG